MLKHNRAQTQTFTGQSRRFVLRNAIKAALPQYDFGLRLLIRHIAAPGNPKLIPAGRVSASSRQRPAHGLAEQLPHGTVVDGLKPVKSLLAPLFRDNRNSFVSSC